MKPERMFSEAPPSREEMTTSRTCRDSVDVKTLTNSGIIAPASVPQVMIDASFHHIVVSPAISGMSNIERRYVSTTEMPDVSHTSDVKGASKFIFGAF